MAALVHNASLSTSLTSTIQYEQFYCLGEESTKMNETITYMQLIFQTSTTLHFR